MNTALIWIFGLFIFVAVVAVLMLRLVISEERVQRRLDRAIGATSAASESNGPAQLLHMRIAMGIGLAVARSGLLSNRTLEELRHTLRMAGIRDKGALAMFVGTKLLSLVGFFAGVLVASRILRLSTLDGLIAAAIAAAFGLLLPDILIQQRRKRFIRKVEAGLAEALDLMVICADAGLSLEPGLTRVAAELQLTHPAVSQELTLTAQEMRISGNIRDALAGLGLRTGLDNLKRLASTLIQTLQYGTPLTQALRTLSAEMRQEQLTRFEERAARLPVLLTLPMIMFILPCVFLVVGGPAVLKLVSSL
ncbi:MAG TPA: type II secretion system F family protein [Acidiphilium sp.]|jgi:tight adherence protein C|uniref:type II secretion system F family protein n=1 Tax=Acidiphilium sp. C61 TaxID=1671485 RepID=UPI00157A40F0|nr:type II secretion system F family protein [Acidiphilium sp. C61]HQU10933.1 type II secretion system F family protein [Acidiphilium sp.]